MAVVLVGLGMMVRFTSLPDIDTDHEDEVLSVTNTGKSSQRQPVSVKNSDTRRWLLQQAKSLVFKQ